MKFNISKIAFYDLLNRNKFISLFITSLPIPFFFIIRTFCKIFSYSDDRIIIISLNRLGDTIFSIPALKLLHKHVNHKVYICCYPEAVPIYDAVLDKANYLLIEKKEIFFGGRVADRNARRRIKLLKPKTVIDFTGTMLSASLLISLRAKKIVGINGKFFRTMYDEYVKYRETPQLVDIYLDIVSSFINIPDRNVILKQPRSHKPDGRILVQPFAGWKEKEWGLKKFIELAEKIKDEYHMGFIFQKGQTAIDVIEDIEKSGINVIQTISVEELLRNISDCSILIGNDSGPINIANFFGKPTFTIYGATNPDYTASCAKHQIYIQKTLSCSAKKNEKYCMVGVGVYDCPGIQCMNFLTVYDVYERLVPLLNKYCKNRSERVN